MYSWNIFIRYSVLYAANRPVLQLLLQLYSLFPITRPHMHAIALHHTELASFIHSCKNTILFILYCMWDHVMTLMNVYYGKLYYSAVYRAHKCVLQCGPMTDIFQLISSVTIRPTAYKKKTIVIHNFVALGMFATELWVLDILNIIIMNHDSGS